MSPFCTHYHTATTHSFQPPPHPLSCTTHPSSCSTTQSFRIFQLLHIHYHPPLTVLQSLCNEAPPHPRALSCIAHSPSESPSSSYKFYHAPLTVLQSLPAPPTNSIMHHSQSFRVSELLLQILSCTTHSPSESPGPHNA